MSETIVLDASVALAWVFEEEANDAAWEALERAADDVVHVPGHWSLEVTNVVLAAERAGRIPRAQAQVVVDLLRDVPVLVDKATSTEAWRLTLAIARRYALTTYDAAYLELAVRTGSSLATLDRTLARAASDSGVLLFIE